MKPSAGAHLICSHCHDTSAFLHYWDSSAAPEKKLLENRISSEGQPERKKKKLYIFIYEHI